MGIPQTDSPQNHHLAGRRAPTLNLATQPRWLGRMSSGIGKWEAGLCRLPVTYWVEARVGIGLNYPLLHFKYSRFHWRFNIIQHNADMRFFTLLVSALMSALSQKIVARPFAFRFIFPCLFWIVANTARVMLKAVALDLM